jgi:hypothetical protein
VRIFKYIDAQPLEIVCGESIAWEKQKELIGATTPDSGRGTEVRPRMQTSFIDIGGATTSDNDNDLSIFHFLQEDVEDESQDLEIVFTDDGGNERTIRGDFYIETVSIDGNAGETSSYRMRLRSSGGVTTGELVDPPASSGESVASDTYTISGGVVQDDDWIGLGDGNIIEVCREGTEQTSMGLSYTFNSGTGTITPDPDTTIEGQKVFVIWTF